MGALAEFIKSILTEGIELVEALMSLIGQFLDGGLAFLHGPITLNASLLPFFGGLQSYAIYGLYTVATVAFGFMIVRILVHLL